MLSGIVDLQEAFAVNNILLNIPFTNILDKSDQCSVVAWRKGQHILQHWFVKSDQQFMTEYLISFAAVSTNYRGNEHAVNVCKRYGLLQHSLLKMAQL